MPDCNKCPVKCPHVELVDPSMCYRRRSSREITSTVKDCVDRRLDRLKSPACFAALADKYELKGG